MSPFALTAELTAQICHRVGIRAHTSTPTQLGEWLTRRCKALSLESPEAYARWLAEPVHQQQEREALCNLLTSRETYFLRDQGVIDVLRDHLLVETIAQKSDSHTLRIWSVGCSTGEEAYTLSILAEEAIVDLSNWKIDILGSDIDQAALNQARQGAYRPWSFRGCPPEFIARYFHPRGNDFQLMDHVKQRVRFEQLDIVGEPYPTSQKGMALADIILCRNVFIYLDHAAIQTALQKLTACLNEGGFLLCAPGELQSQTHTDLTLRIFPQALVYQKITAQAEAVMPSVLPMMAVAQAPTAFLPPQITPPAQSSKPTTELSLAWQLANRGDLVHAQSMCDTLLRTDPLDPHAHYLHAVLLFAQGATALTREALRRVLYLDPTFAVAYTMLSDVYMSENNSAAALKACQQGFKALRSQAENQIVPYLKTVTIQDFLQHLQGRMTSLHQ